MDKINSVEVFESIPTLHIKTATGAHLGITVMPEGCGYGGDITVFHPTEDDLLRIITGASDGLMKLREYNATKGE